MRLDIEGDLTRDEDRRRLALWLLADAGGFYAIRTPDGGHGYWTEGNNLWLGRGAERIFSRFLRDQTLFKVSIHLVHDLN